MVDFIRGLVSGSRKRLQEDGYNLDLTYITDRVIAMSFPSSGFESMYRNDIDDVAKLLTQRHGNKFIVINLSGRAYDYEKFNYMVKDFPWEDHHSPPLELLFQACECIHEFLKKDRTNVAVIHCVAGKGRTGTLISSYLQYSGRFETTKQALQYYKVKRFESGGGVTQPSQIRYVNYFGDILREYVLHKRKFCPLVVRMDKIVMHGIPWISPGYFSPYVEIYSVRDQVKQHTTDRASDLPQFVPNEEDVDSKAEVQFVSSKPIIMTGDILIRVYHKGAWSSQLIFRFGFNTAFLEKGKDNQVILPLSIRDLDPDSIRHDDRFPTNFRVEVCMTALDVPTDKNGPSYAAILDNYKKEIHHWQTIYNVLGDYRAPSKEEAAVLLFKNSQRDDTEARLSGGKKNATSHHDLDSKDSNVKQQYVKKHSL